MTLPTAASMFFTVALLVTTAYFLMGGLPLLILAHDTPVDARFIRSFFNVYYKAASLTAGGACLSHALSGRLGFALGAAAIVAITVSLRGRLIPAMAQLGERIQTAEPAAISGFRRVHSTALLINLAQLVALVWSVTKFSL